MTTALIGFSLYLWRLVYPPSDWAILTLVPLAIALFLGFWRLVLYPWKAKLRLALREESPLSKFITGGIRAAFLSIAFTGITTFVLAWLALSASAWEGAFLLFLVFLASVAFSYAQNVLVRHFYQPFAYATATSFATWMIALPATLLVAYWTWSNAVYPGEMINATFREALQLGISRLPDRGGWIAEVMAIPYAYEAAKLWVVVQFKEYPFVAAIFSLDTALFTIILARASIVVTELIQSKAQALPDDPGN